MLKLSTTLAASLTGLIAILAWRTSYAGSTSSWTKLIDCGAGQTVIDRAAEKTTPSHQIVFRNPDRIGELLQTGAVNTRRLTALNEIVLKLKTRPVGGGFISDDDAREAGGSVHHVWLNADKLQVQVFRTDLEPNGAYRVVGEIGTWLFRPCSRMPE